MSDRPKLGVLGQTDRRSWCFELDGRAAVVRSAELRSPAFGVWTYGRHPKGYDTWWFRENGGGGVISVPYAVDPRGQLWVGLVEEERANMGPGPQLCAIGGFLDTNAEARQAAHERELREEAGVTDAGARELPGAPINPNRAFFITDPEAGDGVHVFAFAVPFALLDGEGDRRRPRAGFVSEEGLTIVFMVWEQAVLACADGLALAALARLRAAQG